MGTFSVTFVPCNGNRHIIRIQESVRGRREGEWEEGRERWKEITSTFAFFPEAGGNSTALYVQLLPLNSGKKGRSVAYSVSYPESAF